MHTAVPNGNSGITKFFWHLRQRPDINREILRSVTGLQHQEAHARALEIAARFGFSFDFQNSWDDTVGFVKHYLALNNRHFDGQGLNEWMRTGRNMWQAVSLICAAEDSSKTFYKSQKDETCLKCGELGFVKLVDPFGFTIKEGVCYWCFSRLCKCHRCGRFGAIPFNGLTNSLADEENWSKCYSCGQERDVSTKSASIFLALLFFLPCPAFAHAYLGRWSSAIGYTIFTLVCCVSLVIGLLPLLANQSFGLWTYIAIGMTGGMYILAVADAVRLLLGQLPDGQHKQLYRF